ncbi:MAG: adenosylcobalamin-dependent ribonucleoside-diphosphate reductase [Phycisphaeraceae bacterium]|nr:adenosylcobalamin-dependent ribonucleoside-diphosphate reductase [Phycisphaeraceae bacterium]
MKISRRFTNTDRDVYDSIEWTTRTSKITNADGSVVFEMNDAEIPASWSQLATDIVVSKYFRKAGVPQANPDGTPMLDDAGNTVLGPERSVRQVVSRLSRCWRHWGERYGYFSTTEDADAFEAELAHMLLNQMAAPNSPQWFNTGLNLAYGITGPAQGHFVPDHATGEVTRAADAYTHPQPHACFIQRVSDDLVGDGGIMDLWTREARLFKYGSGTGTNFSAVRGSDEPLSGGGRSSGLMSFLKIGDRAAGAIKSGGTTRRAAKMVCLDLDHPDIEEFIDWKVREEIKVAALVEGMKNLAPEQQDVARDLGLELDYDFNGEAYYTVSGQNSNNSVRISDQFFDAVDAGGDWNLMRRTDGELSRAIPATGLWEKICFAAWKCADPGVQYDSTINAWHTCPEGGRINASNPCSEYMFLDDTACNLASINLLKFFDSETRTFDIDGYEHAIGLWTIVLEISVLMASFPSEEIARRSWKYRTLGLGYANLGAMLMQSGIPYDSDEGRAICGALTSILTGRSYTASALLAAEHGPFDGYEKNREHMLRVIRNHRRAAHGVARDSGEYEDLRISPVPIDHEEVSRANLANAEDLLRHSTSAWDDALAFGERFGYRNAQVSVIAPTGTIGLLMDCDTTGVEPDFALVKFKKLAGGGYFKIANQSLRPSLASLGYASDAIDSIVAHVMGRLDLEVEMPLPDGTRGDGISFRDFLVEHGYTGEDLVALENVLPTVFELRFAFNAWSMPEAVLRKLGLDPETARADMTFDGLAALGMTVAQRTILNRVICGTQTVEGAPGLKDSDLAVFDCANKCGPDGKRFIAPVGHIHMMAAAQPFISGAISKTINMPADASVEQIGDAYRMSWELGLKANALYRDGCKLSQPLNTTADVEQDDDVDADEALEATGANEAADAMLEASLRDAGAEARVIERVVEKIIERPMRRRLPDTRESVTHKFNVAGHEGYLIVGLYEDGSPGELFITMAKEGSTIGGLMDSLGTAISVALQYGVPVQSLVTKFAHQRFEPMGMTTNSDIPFAKSLVDYIFRWFGMQFVPGYREQNAPRRTPAATPVEVKTIVKEDEQCETKSDTPARDRNFETGLSAGTGKTDAPSTMNPVSGGMAASPSVTSAMRPTENPGTDDPTTAPNVLDQSNASLMGDAPACDVCGSITVRNGTCYKCLNCGNSMGCS